MPFTQLAHSIFAEIIALAIFLTILSLSSFEEAANISKWALTQYNFFEPIIPIFSIINWAMHGLYI